MAHVLHPVYLPVTADRLRGHFAPVHRPGETDRHLSYYLASIQERNKHDDRIRGGDKPTPAQIRRGRQMEKDERFWVATALMTLYHAGDGSAREKAFACLLERGGLRPGPEFRHWDDALAGGLELYFEVSLLSPRRYHDWLRDHLDERVLIPYLTDAARVRAQLEGGTHADAVLLAPKTGVAVIFEAKVLSDVSTHVTFDVARNQLARTIDVMLEENPALQSPLNLRKPGRRLAGARPHLAAVAGIVHHEDLWQLCRNELTGLDVRTGGWDIRGRWFGVVVGATPRTGELPRGETIPWRVIAAQLAPREHRSR